MRYKVYHNDQFLEYFFKENVIGNTVREVAEVECNDLEHVFKVTNNIDVPWTANPEVLSVKTSRPRSLSVGDLVFDVAANTLYVVESIGYREVSDEEHKSLDFQVAL